MNVLYMNLPISVLGMGRRAVLAAATAILLSGAALAQQENCNPEQMYPYGRDVRHFSRDITGLTPQGPAVTYFMRCPANGLVTRYTYRQPLEIDLNTTTMCDEANDIKGRFVGFLYTETRLTDPYAASPDNTRIGRHHAFGRLMDENNVPIANVRMEGTIGTNSSRPPLKIIPNVTGVPVPGCFECDHFTGIMRIDFIQNAAANVPLGTITAFYQFDALRASSGQIDKCDELPWCDNRLRFDGGTLEGINYRRCSDAG